jgi:hypothetical protein
MLCLLYQLEVEHPLYFYARFRIKLIRVNIKHELSEVFYAEL